MFRRAFVPVLALVIALGACGRQITPDSSNSSGGSLLSGTMLVRFRTTGIMDFTKYRYAIVFNTNGDGVEPYANAYLTSFLNYSFVWIVGSQNGFSTAPTLEQVFPINNGLGVINVAVPPQTVTLTLNDNGQNNEFSLLFQRVLFYTQAPTASPTPATAPSALPTSVPTTSTQHIWNINAFVLDQNNVIVDAGGLGPNDTSFTLQVDTSASIDNTLPFSKGGAIAPADPSAAIAGGEIQNQP